MSFRTAAVNLALGAGVTALVLGALEGACRALEPTDAAPAVASSITDWAQWEGDFYTVKSTAAGWPPFEDYNQDGLRDRQHEIERAPGTRRLVCLGDSTTAGYRIRADEAYPRVLQDLLDSLGYHVEVFNVALGGWSTHQELIAYRRIARKYKPDMVLVGVCLNDIPELGNNLGRPPGWLAALYRHSALVRVVTAANDREIRSIEELIEEPGSAKVVAAYEHFFERLRALRDDVQADGGRLAVLVFPFRLQIEPGAPPPTPQEKIVAFCEREGIPHLDLLPAMRAAGEDAYVDYDHFSPLGSQVVADQVVAAGLVPAGAGGAGLPDEIEEHIEVSPEPLPMLVAGLDREDARTRAGALRALGQLGERVGVVPEVAARLDDPDERVRAAAAWALGRLGPRPGRDLRPLVARLDDDAAAVRAGAAWAIGRMGGAARAGVPALIGRLGDPDGTVRRRVADALAHVQPEVSCVPALAAMLDDDAHPAGRVEAARVVGSLGPGAAPAVPALARALRDPDPALRLEVVTALEKIGPGAGPAVPALVEALEDASVRWRVPDALGSIGPTASVATPRLIAALRDANATVRWRAAVALGRIRAHDPRVGPELARLASDPQENVRLGAVVALSRVDAPDTLRLDSYTRALSDPNPEVRTKAAAGLERMGPAASAAVPQLTTTLRDPDTWVRLGAVRALGRIGSAASVAALGAAAQDPEEMVRSAAATALRHSGAAAP